MGTQRLVMVVVALIVLAYACVAQPTAVSSTFYYGCGSSNGPYNCNRLPLMIEGSRVINDSTPADIDANLMPQRTINADTQTLAKDGYHKQDHFAAGGASTHGDSPDHVCGSAWKQCDKPGPYRTMEMMRPDEKYGPARIIDITAKIVANPNYLLSLQDMLDHVARYGPIPAKAWVGLKSGGDAVAYDNNAFKGIDATGHNNFAGWSGDAVYYLVNNTQYNGIFTDRLSVDSGNSWSFEAHYANMGNDHFAFESVKVDDLRLAPAGCFASVGTPRIQGAPEMNAVITFQC